MSYSKGSLDSIIGYSGFVGSNLLKQRSFNYRYNSSNIEEIRGKEFDLIICAGVSGTKWVANRYPKKDLENINRLLDNLSNVRAKKFVLISTVDVYINPENVDENTPIDEKNLHPYGKNRVIVERFIKENFQNYHIIRLPAIYGDNIKKNFVYDLLNDHCLHWTHRDSIFQYYHLKNLWNDIKIVIEKNIKLINFNSEPISAKELALEVFNRDFDNTTEREPHNYDIRSIYSGLFNLNSKYMYDKNQVFNEMKDFIKKY